MSNDLVKDYIGSQFNPVELSNFLYLKYKKIENDRTIKNLAIEFVETYWDGVKSGENKTLNLLLDFDDGGISSKWSKEDCINEINDSVNGLELAIWFIYEMCFHFGYEEFKNKYYIKTLSKYLVKVNTLKINNQYFRLTWNNYIEVFPKEITAIIYE